VIYLNGAKHSLSINMSSQANTFKCTRANLGQYNFIAVLGLEYLTEKDSSDKIPISINIDEDWNLSLEGFDENSISEGNIQVYTDKKVTESDQ